jgi:hypothetical protein
LSSAFPRSPHPSRIQSTTGRGREREFISSNLGQCASLCIRETRRAEIAFPILIPVVRVTGKYLLGAIELLEEHAADEQMRPCHRSE